MTTSFTQSELSNKDSNKESDKFQLIHPDEFSQFKLNGFKFLKTVGKNDVAKESFAKALITDFSEVTEWITERPNAALKIIPPSDILTLDFDAHVNSDLTSAQIKLIEDYCKNHRISHDVTPHGIHIFLKVDGIEYKKTKVTRVTSLGARVEVFPPGKAISTYAPVFLDGAGSISNLPLSFSLTNVTMSILGRGYRHDGLKNGLIRYGTSPVLHSLFNALWCEPPLEEDELSSLSKWIMENIQEKSVPSSDNNTVERLTELFLQQKGSTYLFDPYNDCWLEREDSDRPVFKSIPIKIMRIAVFNWAKESLNCFLSTAKVTQLIHQLELVLFCDQLSQRDVICFRNGVYFKGTPEFIPYSELNMDLVVQHFIPLDYSADDSKVPPVWSNFIEDLFDLQTVKATDVLTLIVAHFLGKINGQYIYYLFGPPRSGKSTISTFLNNLFGSEIGNFTLANMGTNPRFFTSFLINKRGIIFPDVRLDTISNQAVDSLKRLTGSDFLTVETKGQTLTKELRCEFPVLITSQSNLSYIQDAGLYRRIIPIPFTKPVAVSQVNLTLAKELAESSAWLVMAALKLSNEDARSIALKISTETIGSFDDPIHVIIAEHLEFSDTHFTKAKDVYERYLWVCQEIGIEPNNKKRFNLDLLQRIALVKGLTLGNCRKLNDRGIRGVRLLPMTELSPDPMTDPSPDPMTDPSPDPMTDPSQEDPWRSSERISQVWVKQQKIASQISHLLLQMTSRYQMDTPYPDACVGPDLLDLYAKLFEPLQDLESLIDTPKEWELLVKEWEVARKSSKSTTVIEKTKWFNSKRLKSRAFPFKVYVKDVFYPRLYETQSILFNKKGKKIGSNTPNVSMLKEVRQQWYGHICTKLFDQPPISVDLNAAHLYIYSGLLRSAELDKIVRSGKMWELVMDELPTKFKRKPFLKKLLYSGLNGGSPRTFSNGWAEMGYLQGIKDPQWDLDLLEWETISQQVLLFKELKRFNDTTMQLVRTNQLYTPFSSQPVQLPTGKGTGTGERSYIAGSRILGSIETLTIISLICDHVLKGGIILAPEHDGVVLAIPPGTTVGKEDTLNFRHISETVLGFHIPFDTTTLKNKSISEIWRDKFGYQPDIVEPN